ncbi:MAG: PEP-CTERM sorting domain-containing protein [Candidatus Solibacter usitatus]|nr:PEP-CTERM sorting domain-containing protein [Candidatus Solibacter usitatus]
MKRNFITLCFLTLASAAVGAAGITAPSPVPEPGSIVLLGSAAIGIGYAAWRRSRNK